MFIKVVLPNPDSPTTPHKPLAHVRPKMRLRTDNHNGKMGATFRNNFVPLKRVARVRVLCEHCLMTLTWIGRLAMPMPSEGGVGMVSIVNEGQ